MAMPTTGSPTPRKAQLQSFVTDASDDESPVNMVSPRHVTHLVFEFALMRIGFEARQFWISQGDRSVYGHVEGAHSAD